MSNVTVEVGLPERLAEACDELGLSTPELARSAKISESSAYKYVGGRQEPSGSNLLRIARVLGVTVDWLLTGEGPRYRRRSDEPGTRRDEPVSSEAAAP